MSLQILTTCWGPHIELFQKTALRSLAWEDNRAALQRIKAVWNIFCDDTKKMEKICKKSELDIKFNIQGTEKLRDYIDQVQSANIWQMKESIETGDKVLLAPPDTIFGDGTVDGLLQAGQDQESVVVVPHPRVLPKILDDTFLPNGFNNEMLVAASWEYLHDSWVHAERGHPNQSSYVGGVEWWKFGDIIQGTHRLPSPYLIQFTKEDLQYFQAAISFGHFDHMWPGDILLPRGRQRYVASSDSCFIVEITEADKNVPPIIENQPKTGFWRSNPHNINNAMITFTFRR